MSFQNEVYLSKDKKEHFFSFFLNKIVLQALSSGFQDYFITTILFYGQVIQNPKRLLSP